MMTVIAIGNAKSPTKIATMMTVIDDAVASTEMVHTTVPLLVESSHRPVKFAVHAANCDRLVGQHGTRCGMVKSPEAAFAGNALLKVRRASDRCALDDHHESITIRVPAATVIPVILMTLILALRVGTRAICADDTDQTVLDTSGLAAW